MTDTKTRFSRATVLFEIERQMRHLEYRHGFKEGEGRIVVAFKPDDTKIAFGRYEVLRDLSEEFGEI